MDSKATQKKHYQIMPKNENIRKAPSDNIGEAELSIIYVRKKMWNIMDNLSTSRIVHIKQRNKLYKYNKFKILKCTKPQIKCYHNKKPYIKYKSDMISCRHNTKMYSTPILNYLGNEHNTNRSTKSWNNLLSSNTCALKSNFIVNSIFESQYQHSEYLDLNNNSFPKPCWKVYRCQLNAKEESCCCSCNSDAMFEVMKSLYDCYKKKNCDNCNCILCAHLPREERRLGELRKLGEQLSGVPVSEFMKPEYIKKLPSSKVQKLKAAGLLTPIEGKSPDKKEEILRGLAMNGIPLPKGKTNSDKNLIEKIRKEVGLPPEPKTLSEKKRYQKAMESGFITPLLGKSPSEKERILKGQADLGLMLPEGRTMSEKNLIAKLKALKTPSSKLLKGKTPEEKEDIIKDLAMRGMPLPEGKTASEKKIIDKVRAKVGLPPAPKTPSAKVKYDEAFAAGNILPLEGKTTSQKEQILREQAKLGVPLPEGRTSSEKALIAKIKADTLIPSDMIKRAKAGMITPLQGKTPEQKEAIIRELAMHEIPLPEGKTASEKQVIDKVRKELGLPPEPTTPSLKEKYKRAQEAGVILPLEGKTKSQQAKILVKQAEMGIPLADGRTPSEKALVNKIRATVKPLTGKPPEEQKKILNNIVKAGLPMPEGTTPSEKQIIKRVQDDMGIPSKGLPSELFQKAKAAGLITPLEGKTKAQKEKILRDKVAMGLPLPEGATPSDKELIRKVKEATGYTTPKFPSKIIKAKSAGLVTPLEGKTPSQKEKILEHQLAAGLPLPEGKTPSEKELIEKVKKKKHPKLLSIQGKSPSQKEKVLRHMAKQGLPLPEPKTASDKAIIDKVKAELRKKRPYSAKLRSAKAAGLLTPLEGKTAEQKENILRGLAKAGIPLPEGKTSSEKKIIQKVREEVGLPPEPKTASLKEKMKQAQIDGIITPLEGKTPSEKEKILLNMHEAGIPLPTGRTASEKALIKKVKAGVITRPHKVSSKKLREAKAAGLLTPLEGKTLAQKEKIVKGLAKAGLPLPEGKTPSEKALINKVQEKVKKIEKKSAKVMKEGKGPSDECICDMLIPITRKKRGISMTALIGKTPEQKEEYLKDLALQGIPLPEAKTKSDKKLMDKIRTDLGLPPEPTTPSLREKYKKAQEAGIITPLKGKSPSQKEKILREQAAMGLLLPEGATSSERELIAKVKATTPPIVKIKSEKLRKAKAAGLLTPLKGKSAEQKEKILKGLAMHGIPLPEPKSSSERNIIDKVRAEVGLPPEPKTLQERARYDRAIAAGIITPLQGKSPSMKEKILRGQAEMGLSLPEGRTTSEKDLIAKIKATTLPLSKVHMPLKSEKLRRAKAAGILTPLDGKSPEQKEKILKGLAMHGIPLPEPKTSSERNIIDKVLAEVGLPPKPKTEQEKDMYDRAIAAGIITPLQGKSPSQKEKILRAQAEMGLPLPEGRTRSEKELIAKVVATTRPPVKVKSEKLRKAKAAGLLTPLAGKSAEQKEKILKGLAMHGIPLPDPKTRSEKNIIDKVRAEVGLPPEPKSRLERARYDRATAAGIITPLEGKSPSQKEKILRGQAELGLPLPEGRTRSEKELIAKVRATTLPLSKVQMPLKSEKLRRAKAAGILTPLEGKSPEQKEKILKGLATHGIPLPEPKTMSERNIMEKVRAEMGLPPEPKTPEERDMYDRAVAAGIITPLEGKSPSQKERILREQAEMGLPLPEGRTQSEKELVEKIRQTTPPPVKVKSEKLRKAKAAGLLTPLTGKSPEQKEKILKGLAMHGIPLPEPKTTSEKNIIDKVRAEVGLPPEPKSRQERARYDKATAAGIITPLAGKSPSQKEKILRAQAQLGLPLPEGRTRSEKDLIAKVRATTLPLSKVHMPLKSEKLRRAKAAGILTPLDGKSREQKEKILRGLAMHGIPLPEPKTNSERNIIKKVRAEVGLPPEPKTQQEKDIYKRAIAAGIITPLEGKSPSQKARILREQADMGLPLPEGRTQSEKELVAKIKQTTPPPVKVKSEKLRKAKAAGLITPLAGKSPEQKEKILKGLAMHGIPLPEPTTPSERNIIDKVRAEVGLPPEPKSRQERARYDRATAAGIITPLEGKSPSQKEKILRGQAELGLPLPEGRTRSEKDLIAKVRATTLPLSKVHMPLKSEKLRRAKAAGILTPLDGKSPEQKEKILKGLAMHGIPLPEPKTNSERNIMDKVRAEVGLPPEPKTQQEKDMYKRAIAAGIITPLQGKSPSQKERILREQADMGLPLPEGRTRSEKELVAKIKQTMPPPVKVKSEKLRKAKAAGLLTPLAGKSPEQKEKILKGLALHGIPLPKPTTSSERNIIDKVRAEIGLPPEPKTPQDRAKYDRAVAAGIVTPLEGKSPSQKERILREQAYMGLPLPEGRTRSEKDLVAKIKQTMPTSVKVKSEKLRKAKAAGLLTPLVGKSPEQKEKIIKGLAMHGIPLPEPTTSSERNIIDKVRAEIGLPPEPKTAQEKAKYNRAVAAGIITPLEGKSPSQKERILREQAEMGLPLPEGRTQSEKDLVAKIRQTTPPPVKVKSEKLRKAKGAGLLTPLAGKSPEQKEKIIKGLAMHGIPLPEPTTSSERNIIDKVRAEIGLPPEPKTLQDRVKYDRAVADGIITPLEGKSPSQKERILRKQAEIGLPLPEGRTQSEKDLVAKIRRTTPPPVKVKSEKLRKAKAAGLLTPLAGKSPEQKEKILRGLAMHGIPLPEPKTRSEKNIIDKVRAEVGLPPEPKSRQERARYDRATAAGVITPLEGKSPSQKEKILRGQAELGLPLPEGRTRSEKELIAKVRATTLPLSKVQIPLKSEKLRRAKAAGILTPLDGKSRQQKEKILKGLATHGIPLPEPKTSSERNIINKVRAEVGLPPEPKTEQEKKMYEEAIAAGIITPLQGKSPSQKEKILRDQARMGLPLPVGRTASEKALIKKVKHEYPRIPPEKVASFDKKTAKVMKEGKGPSDECICHILSPRRPSLSKKSTIYKIPSEKMRKAKEAGLLTPLEGKTVAQKEKIIKGLALQGIPLPEAKTDSERKLIDKVRADLGLPPEPVTKSAKKVYNKALADGYITPLEGKSKAQKEKILRKQAELGLLLPEGRTPSEKSLIAKIKETAAPPLETVSLRKRLSKARAAGLLTPLEGKTDEQKKKILKTLAEAGLPLPEGKTPSEKSLVKKIEAEYGGLSKSKRKSIKVGERKRKTKGGITEEFEDIVKTTTCDRACGCDKKKIRFKHSYVKIRVTSPDISSLCPCPEECVPGVKGGVFTDNEGIKVTVGRVTGVPSFSSRKSFIDYQTNFKPSSVSCDSINILSNYCNNNNPAEITKSLTYCNNSTLSQNSYLKNTSNKSSFESMYLLNRDSSVSLLTLPTSISIISFSTTGSSANTSTGYTDIIPYSNLDLSEYLHRKSNYSSTEYIRNSSSESPVCFSDTYSHFRSHFKNNKMSNLLTFGINESRTCYLMEKNNLTENKSPIDDETNDHGIHKFICRILSRQPINSTSSLIIIMSATSDEHTSKYSLADRQISSTIGLDLLENYGNWNYKPNSLHHLCQEQKGFKITRKGRACERNLLDNEPNDPKHQTHKNNYRIVSLDTTQDRPCCCEIKENRLNVPPNISRNKDDSVISESVTNTIQGLSHATYTNSRDDNITHQQLLTVSQSNPGIPIRFCKVPPCNDRTKNNLDSTPFCGSKNISSSKAAPATTFKECDCTPEKLMDFFEKKSKEMLSKACNTSIELVDNNDKKNQFISERHTHKCNKCGLKKISQATSTNENQLKSVCSCENQKVNKSIENNIENPLSKSNFDEQLDFKQNEGFQKGSTKGCLCKEQKKPTHKVLCECPAEPEPEPEYDFVDWIDEKQIRKYKSDLTQSVSGFKINKPRKYTDEENLELEMSFEETLRYIAENLENESNKQNNVNCSCKSGVKLQSKNDCECPFDPHTFEIEEETLPEEPFMGIKFHISGKGSGSKGLNGILCFQLLKNLSNQFRIQEHNEL